MFGNNSKNSSEHADEPQPNGGHAKHPERDAWLKDKAAHGGDPPYPTDGSDPSWDPESVRRHGDPEEMNRDTRFKEPH
jgi:hypothetical protein